MSQLDYASVSIRDVIEHYRDLSANPHVGLATQQAAQALADILRRTWSVRLTVEHVVQWVYSTRRSVQSWQQTERAEAQDRLVIYEQFLAEVGVRL